MKRGREDLLSNDSSVDLHGKVRMPMLGFGMSHNGGDCEDAVVAALKDGCRLLDTAARYGTEGVVKSAVQRAKVPYDEVFVTTKLWPADAGRIESALKTSLSNLGRDSTDLYLVHWPSLSSDDPSSRTASEHRVAVWRSMERMLDAGLTRSIGVSNFLIPHLEDLLHSGEVATPPALNQFELNPWQRPESLVSFCKDHGIVVEGYSPLAKAQVLSDTKLASLAGLHSHADGAPVAPAQLLIRWALQHGAVTIPKTTNPARAVQNRNVFDFEISDKHMREIDGWHSNLRVTWDPSGVE